jgi:hypothetical protein
MALVFSSPSGPVGAIVELCSPTGNVQSPVLDLGAQGPTGPTGPTGPAGGAGATGTIRETFSGGNSASIVAASTNANIGDNGWNYFLAGTSTGNSCNKLVGEVGATGIARIVSPTVLFSTAAVYLGSSTAGTFNAAGWAECTFRARFDTTVVANAINTVFLVDSLANLLGAGESAGFLSQLAGAGGNANIQTRTSHLSAGNAVKSTGVPADGSFHDFRIVRVSSTQLDFYIDGVLRTTHSVALGDGIPTGPLIPAFQATGGGASIHTDCDDFSFIPI